MKTYDIRVYPDPVLTLKTEKVENFDGDLREIIDSMLLTLQVSGGVGLAAPQIGISKRIAVISHENAQYVLINPEVTEQFGSETKEEGCLSFPDVFAQVTRPYRVKIRANSADGEVRIIDADGQLARVFLHEMDHLDGKLFIDLLSPLKRGMIRKKMKKRATG